ncbi:MAG: lactate utilization protein [Acidimicrobiia bacterium]
MSTVVEAFAERMRANRCGVHGPFDAPEAAQRIVELARGHARGADVAVPVADPLLRDLGLDRALAAAGAAVLRSDEPGWDERLATAGAGVTGSLLAVAERGSIALSCGPGMPRATSLLPPVHVCAVRTATIVETFPEAIATAEATGPLPSALTWVGGPSRTGDLEMKTTFGVHGPKTVEIVLIRG